MDDATNKAVLAMDMKVVADVIRYTVLTVMMSWKTVLYVMNTIVQKHVIKVLIIKDSKVRYILSDPVFAL